jgi:shikimate kinase
LPASTEPTVDIDAAGRAPAHVVLVGMMGVGKSTVGRALAARLKRPFVDSDEQVQARTGRTVAQLFDEHGEEYFRREEALALRQALTSSEPAVIAAAGGTVLDAANREQIAAHAALVVWLRAAPEILAGRVRQGDHRPLLADDPLGTLRRLDRDRRELYAEVATLILDVKGRAVSALVRDIVSALPAREPS